MLDQPGRDVRNIQDARDEDVDLAFAPGTTSRRWQPVPQHLVAGISSPRGCEIKGVVRVGEELFEVRGIFPSKDDEIYVLVNTTMSTYGSIQGSYQAYFRAPIHAIQRTSCASEEAAQIHMFAEYNDSSSGYVTNLFVDWR